MAQGDARGARRERLVDVDEVERELAQRVLDRPRDVDRQRRRPALGRRERQHLADAEHERCPRRPARAATSGRTVQRAARVPHELARLRRRDDQHAVTPPRELVGDPRDVLVDLVRRLPGERGHLRDRECAGHGAEDRSRCAAYVGTGGRRSCFFAAALTRLARVLGDELPRSARAPRRRAAGASATSSGTSSGRRAGRRGRC